MSEKRKDNCGQEILGFLVTDRTGKKVPALLNRCAECNNEACRQAVAQTAEEEKSP